METFGRTWPLEQPKQHLSLIWPWNCVKVRYHNTYWLADICHLRYVGNYLEHNLDNSSGEIMWMHILIHVILPNKWRSLQSVINSSFIPRQLWWIRATSRRADDLVYSVASARAGWQTWELRNDEIEFVARIVISPSSSSEEEPQWSYCNLQSARRTCKIVQFRDETVFRPVFRSVHFHRGSGASYLLNSSSEHHAGAVTV